MYDFRLNPCCRFWGRWSLAGSRTAAQTNTSPAKRMPETKPLSPCATVMLMVELLLNGAALLGQYSPNAGAADLNPATKNELIVDSFAIISLERNTAL